MVCNTITIIFIQYIVNLIKILKRVSILFLADSCSDGRDESEEITEMMRVSAMVTREERISADSSILYVRGTDWQLTDNWRDIHFTRAVIVCPLMSVITI